VITFAEARLAFAESLHRLLTSSDEQEWFTAQQIAAASRLDVRGAFVARVIRISEEEDEFFEITNNDGEPLYALARLGFKIVESSMPPEFQPISAPASDRIVSLNHNAEREAEIQTALEDLEEAVRTDNEAFKIVPLERDVAIAEISALRRLWAASCIRIETFQVQASAVLKWVSEKASAVAIGEACKHVLKLILGWS
jgi:hypothetical protein